RETTTSFTPAARGRAEFSETIHPRLEASGLFAPDSASQNSTPPVRSIEKEVDLCIAQQAVDSAAGASGSFRSSPDSRVMIETAACCKCLKMRIKRLKFSTSCRAMTWLLLITGGALLAQSSGARNLRSGKEIFEAGCAGCHGGNGRGAPQ